MCDYCDCRSHPVIADLSAEHLVLQELLAELGRAADRGDAATAAGVLRELHDLLGEHAAFEERGVFAELRAAEVEDGYLERFEDDHDRIHALLEACGTDEWPPAARDLVSLLGAHIHREETDLFPAAHQVLAPAQWDEIDGRRLAAR